MKQWRTFCAALLLVVCAHQISGAADQAYSMKDLRALADQGAWSELATHLEDIRPGERGADWNAVLEQTATGLLEQGGEANDAYNALAASDALIGRFPKLKASKPFMAKRAEVGLRAYGVCFQDNYSADRCLQELTKFVATDSKNLDLAFKAGKLARLNLKHWAAAPFFAKALVERSNDRRCDDKDVALAVLSGLALPSEGYEPQYGASVKLATELCWQELKGPLTEQMASNGEYFRQNTCAVFKSKNALEGEAANVCRKYQK
jgi:hypothetical protein